LYAPPLKLSQSSQNVELQLPGWCRAVDIAINDTTDNLRRRLRGEQDQTNQTRKPTARAFSHGTPLLACFEGGNPRRENIA